ncbi:DNA ligase D [Agriterribacter sp.]|uniref:DNA ligase D n=1 Tax=Agriterribacter sp. TaxID=2821509 RepID=UPI002CC16824|nr:DNA ligase D [Agriterribacter sp.]HRO48124.1 DNA ligase D [Agriterribacter sp.]HRQ19124.1 DNA ligase D [Agriterribacter sp.]
MSLSTYKKKRIFSKTPEPTGGKSNIDELRFVIQKHAATNLHYDFRLEMAGVLKSWAVPKGPSTDPSVKRLAMMVEDHPFDYRTFEGIIPKGQYGGGAVMIWDEGTYEPAAGDFTGKKEKEKALLRELHKGKIVFDLNGEKLKGRFALVQSSYRGENSWLLMKVKDKYAKATEILKKEKSVASGRTLKQIEKDSSSAVHGKTIKKNSTVKKNNKPSAAKKAIAGTGKKMKFPATLQPMLATLADKPFDEEGWLYEVKWDGYRAIALLNHKSTHLRSRNNKSFNEKFYPVYDALKALQLNAVLDGEIIVANEDGLSNFGKLQNWLSEADGELKFYVFDVLWLNGYSLMQLPLEERREKLTALLPAHPAIHISQAFDTTGTEFFETAKKMKLEGIVAKKADSLYIPGTRSKEWLKIKVDKKHEVVIGGYTQNEGSPKHFSSLLAGVYEKNKLVYTGKIGTGFSEQVQKEMMEQFKPLITTTNPFTFEPDINKPSRFRPRPSRTSVTWLKPKLICEVSYTEMTDDGLMRHPAFEGMREDKKALDVHPEKPVSTKALLKNKNHMVQGKKNLGKNNKPERKTLLDPKDQQQERKINGHPLTFTNLGKLYWPKEKISKRDMLNYYYQAAPYILPYLKDRPQSLNRHPNGINGKSFYQKDVTGKVPGWIKTFPYHSAEDERDKHFMVCTDEASLLYMASLGCIEMNPWSSRIQLPDHPDWCVIDLDPDNNKFEQVIAAAQVTRQVLESAGVTSYCKTSGSTGLHIYIPLGAAYTYESSKEFARMIVTFVHEQLPGFTSIERTTAKRKGKIYLDFLQNRPQATLAAAYSLRPKPGATVSMPLHWEEVKKGLSMQDFTIHNALSRMKQEDDLFKPVLGKGINMKKVITAFEKL